MACAYDALHRLVPQGSCSVETEGGKMDGDMVKHVIASAYTYNTKKVWCERLHGK